MCNLYTIERELWDLVEDFERFRGLQLGSAMASNRPYARTVYPRYESLFVRPADPADPAGPLEPVVGRWGIVPFFHKGPATAWKFPTNNARSEEMASKPSFRDALKARRCLVPATAICEWTGPKGAKTRHAIAAADGGPLLIAGLWARHVWEGETTESYTMVMQATRPGDDLAPFHDRQPVFLEGAAAARTWLDPAADYAPLLASPPPGALVIDPPEPAGA